MTPLRERHISLVSAQMAKLVDALVSGTSVSNDVQVRVLFWAQDGAKAQRCNGAKALRKQFFVKIKSNQIKFKVFSHCASAPLIL